MISLFEFFGFGGGDPSTLSGYLNTPKVDIDTTTMSPDVALYHLQKDTQELLSKPGAQEALSSLKIWIPGTDASNLENRLERNIRAMNNLNVLSQQYHDVAKGGNIRFPNEPTTMEQLKSHLPYVGGGLLVGGLLAGGRAGKAFGWIKNRYRQNKLNSQYSDVNSLLRNYYRQ